MMQCTFEKEKAPWGVFTARFAMFVDWSINTVNLAVKARKSLILCFIKPSHAHMYHNLVKEHAKPQETMCPAAYLFDF